MSPLIRRLTPSDTFSSFDCGDATLNRYLLRYAKENHFSHSVGITYVALNEHNEAPVLGYYTVAVANVPREPIAHMFAPTFPPYHLLPCVLLGRLAVQKHEQGKGIGAALLQSAFQTALKIKEEAGCRLMIVDAYATAVSFYEQYGFTALSPQLEGSKETKMFLDLNTVAGAKRADNIVSISSGKVLHSAVLFAA